MSEEIVSSSQTETAPDVQEEVFADPREAFGLPPKEASDDVVNDDEGRSDNDPPAKEEVAEPKKMTVKYNKEDVEIDEDKIPEYVQKGLALDKTRELAKQRENELDRAAKLLGYKDHGELTVNLDRIERERQQQQVDQFQQAKQKIIDDLVYNGVDEQTAIEYAENNPLVQQARATMEKEQLQEQARQLQSFEQQRLSGWAQLYETFPDVGETAKDFADGGKPTWYTSEMESMVAQGYKPLDAYRLAHMDKIQTQTKKQAEQKAIKQQMLGQRAQVEGQSPIDNTPQASEELRSAFSAFGLDPKRANKYAKKVR